VTEKLGHVAVLSPGEKCALPLSLAMKNGLSKRLLEPIDRPSGKRPYVGPVVCQPAARLPRRLECLRGRGLVAQRQGRFPQQVLDGALRHARACGQVDLLEQGPRVRRRPCLEEGGSQVQAEHGLFCRLAAEVIVAGPGGVRVLTRGR